MNLQKVFVVGVILLCLGVACQHAKAAPVVYSYVTDQSNYSVAPGGTVTVLVYLQETLNGNTSIVDGHGESGLFAGAFKVIAGSGPANPSTITTVAINSTNFGGSGSETYTNVTATPNVAEMTETVSDQATHGVALANGSGASATEVFLGSLTVVGGSTRGATSFSLGEFSPSGGYTFTYPDAYDMDLGGNAEGTPFTGVGTTTYPFTVTVTPEPGSAALIGLCGAGLLLRRRRTA